jgi:exopolyphosphatase/guanosine-5'-triphosphate,3'-diphosphate pyrophosphatase
VKVAAVDIGTNTVRLLIADVVDDGQGFRVQDAERHEVITRLGEGLDATGHLGEEPMGRALAGLCDYGGLIHEAGVERMAGVATAATRSAANGTEFIARVVDAIGFRPRVIDGIEEARLTFTGAANALPRAESFCVIDVGGGSTEFVVGQDLPDYAISVDIGSVRLTERVKSRGLPDSAAVREYVDTLFRHVLPPYPPSQVLGSGGTFVTLSAAHCGFTESEVSDRSGLVLRLDDLQATVNRLLQMTVAEIAELPAVAPARAAVLQAGAICAERAVARIGSAEVRISVADILDGIALELAE